MKIGLQNFQGITTYQEIQLKPITLIYGKNSSGKSTILDALTVAKSIHKDFSDSLPAKWVNDLEKNISAIGGGLDTILKVSDLFIYLSKFDTWIREAGIFAETEGRTVLNEILGMILDETLDFSCEFHWETNLDAPNLHTYKLSISRIPILSWTKHGKQKLSINLSHPLTKKLDSLFDFISENSYPWVISDNQALLDYDLTSFSGSIDEIIGELSEFDHLETTPLFILAIFFTSGITEIIQGSCHELNIPPIRPLTHNASDSNDQNWFSTLAKYHEHSILDDSQEDRELFGGYLLSINNWLSDKEYLNTGFKISPKTSFALTLHNLETYAKLPEEERMCFLRNTALIETKIELLDTIRNKIVELDDVGTGISQVIPVLCGAACSRAYIQQPELHLHPAMQPPLADIFIESVNAPRSWVCPESLAKFYIIETHSELLALRILRRIRETSAGKHSIEFAPLPSDYFEAFGNEPTETITLSEDGIAHMLYNGRTRKKSFALTPDSVSVIYVARMTTGEMTITNLRVSLEGDFLDRWPEGFFDERSKELFEEDE